MGQITIRGIAPEVEQEVRKISEATGKSLNRVIQEIICQHLGFTRARKTAPADSLRKLAGGWSEKEADEFFETIKSCEQLDVDMWK